MPRSVHSLPVEIREHVAENMKERVYATITLIALITALWQTAEYHSAGGAIASIVGTVVALWLATLISARVSHRAIHGKSLGRGDIFKLMFTSSGLFLPSITPTFIILISLAGVLSLKNALLVSIIALLLSLFTLSFMASRRIYANNLGRAVWISLLEMSVGVGVVLLKLAIGE